MSWGLLLIDCLAGPARQGVHESWDPIGCEGDPSGPPFISPTGLKGPVRLNGALASRGHMGTSGFLSLGGFTVSLI
jgi:hypothetical protein